MSLNDKYSVWKAWQCHPKFFYVDNGRRLESKYKYRSSFFSGFLLIDETLGSVINSIKLLQRSAVAIGHFTRFLFKKFFATMIDKF